MDYLHESRIDYRFISEPYFVAQDESYFYCFAYHAEVEKHLPIIIAMPKAQFAERHRLVNEFNRRSVNNKLGWTYIVNGM